MSGYLITFEGPDGGGKTTHIEPLIKHLQGYGLDVVTFREPGGTHIGDQIRHILHNPENMEMGVRPELLLYMGSRAQLTDEKLIPSLDMGKVVVLDRFRDSSEAYQGGGRDIDRVMVKSLNDFATRGILPDLTLFFAIDAETALRRREAGSALGEEWNRLDAEQLAFHHQVYETYWRMISEDSSGRWEIIDSNVTREEVFEQVKSIVDGRLISAGLLESSIKGKERC